MTLEVCEYFKLETDKNIELLSNGLNTIIFNKATMKVAAVTDETAKVVEILKIPRSYDVFKNLWMKSHSSTNTDELEGLINILISHEFIHANRTEHNSCGHKRLSRSKYTIKPPNTAALNVTKLCNLSCAYCYNENDRTENTEQDLSVEEWRRVICDMIDYGVSNFQLTGGEPLLRMDLFPLYSELKKRNVSFTMNTNATLIDNMDVAFAIGDLMDGVTISIDSYIESEHELLRGKSTFNRVLKGAEYLTRAGVKWYAQMVCSSHNVKSIGKTRELVEKLGGSGLNANIIYDPNICMEEFSSIISTLDLSSADAATCLFSEALAKENKHTANPLIKADMHCAAAVNECSVDHAGNLYACRLMTAPEMRCGNLLNQRFGTIWEESIVLKRVRNIDYSAIEPCNTCIFFRLCFGGCRAMAQKISGDLLGFPGDAYCANKKRVIFDKLIKSCQAVNAEEMVPNG